MYIYVLKYLIAIFVRYSIKSKYGNDISPSLKLDFRFLKLNSIIY